MYVSKQILSNVFFYLAIFDVDMSTGEGCKLWPMWSIGGSMGNHPGSAKIMAIKYYTFWKLQHLFALQF